MYRWRRWVGYISRCWFCRDRRVREIMQLLNAVTLGGVVEKICPEFQLWLPS
jgi:hypothetical protein